MGPDSRILEILKVIDHLWIFQIGGHDWMGGISCAYDIIPRRAAETAMSRGICQCMAMTNEDNAEVSQESGIPRLHARRTARIGAGLLCTTCSSTFSTSGHKKFGELKA
jgi:hypothetical protein